MIVVDGGAYFEFLLRSPGGLHLEALLAIDRGVAPELFDAEVLHRISRETKHGEITAALAREMVRSLVAAPVQRFSHRGLLTEALRYSAALSGYDALHVALAAIVDCPLATTDRRLAATAANQFALTVAVIATSGRSGR